MSRPTLYLFVGYPGAGKTTAAKALQEATGATHLWADNIRWQMFPEPCHSPEESRELYEHLNDQTAQLLRAGESVIFDTNFNFRADRDYLRHIAEECGANTVLIWLTTPETLAHERASHSKTTRNGYTVNMSHKMFENIVAKLEAPTKDENPIKFDGTKLDVPALKAQFGKHDMAETNT